MGVVEVGVAVWKAGLEQVVGRGLAGSDEPLGWGERVGFVVADSKWRVLSGYPQLYLAAGPVSGAHSNPFLSLLQTDLFCRQNRSPCPWTWGKTPPSAAPGEGTHFHGLPGRASVALR